MGLRGRLKVAAATGASLGLGVLAVLACGDPGDPASPSPVGPGPTPAADAGGGEAAPPCQDQPVPDAGRVHVTGTVTEAVADVSKTGPVIPNAVVAVEYGGLYLPWCDLSKASPYYVYGALTDDAGRFEIDVAEGSLGFHSFANDYLYTRAPLDTSKGRDVSLTMEPLPKGQAQPTLASVAFDKSSVAPGETVTLSATVATWKNTDPLSDETLLVEPTGSWGAELDPPGQGKKDDFPDGVWRRTFAAPAKTGTYTYWLSATTASCITSQLLSLTLTVR
jgi:hypothetical protein